MFNNRIHREEIQLDSPVNHGMAFWAPSPLPQNICKTQMLLVFSSAVCKTK
jgi:hypothetical protein